MQKKKVSKFAERVHSVVRSIPKGSVMTYGEVAKRAGNPGAARAVGTLMSHNQDKTLACHRVVPADGKIGKYNGLRGMSKETLLKREGYLRT